MVNAAVGRRLYWRGASIAPCAMTCREAASADNGLALMPVGVAILLPAILGYTVRVYRLFRGKVGGDAGYH